MKLILYIDNLMENNQKDNNVHVKKKWKLTNHNNNNKEKEIYEKNKDGMKIQNIGSKIICP